MRRMINKTSRNLGLFFITLSAIGYGAFTVPLPNAVSAPVNMESHETDPALTQSVNSDEQVAPSGQRVVINSGHVDLGPRLRDGNWQVLARDDTQAAPVWREPEDVVFKVDDTARLEVPHSEEYSFIDGDSAWIIPQQEILGVPWLGWNTQDPEVVSKVPASVDIVFLGHEGAGGVTVFVQAGNFAGPQLLWNSAISKSQPVTVETNTHTHANWVFSEPGVHQLRFAFTARLRDGSTVGDTLTLTFAVGSSTDEKSAWSVVSAKQKESVGKMDSSEFITDSEQSKNGETKVRESKGTAGDASGWSTTFWVGRGFLVVVLFMVVFGLVKRWKTRQAQKAALL